MTVPLPRYHPGSMVARPRVPDFPELGLGAGVAPAQGIEPDPVRVEIDLAPDQAVGPGSIDGEGVSEQRGSPRGARPAEEDDLPPQRRLPVKLPRRGERAARWRRLVSEGRLPSVRRNVAGRDGGEPLQALVVAAVPDFELPAAVEALHPCLEPVLLDRGKYWRDGEAQAEARHAANRVPELVRPLEARVVVELGVRREPQGPPVGHEGVEDYLGRHRADGPRPREAAMEREGGQHVDVDPAFDHQVLDDIEAVQFRLRRGDLWEVPPPGRGRAADAVPAIEGATPLEDPTDRAHRRDRLDTRVAELAMDGRRPVLPEGAGHSEVAADGEDSVLDRGGRPVDQVRGGGAVRPVHPIQPLRPGPVDPAFDRRPAHSELARYRSDRLPSAHCFHHGSTSRLLSFFSP
jgi:hypothetical protein